MDLLTNVSLMVTSSVSDIQILLTVQQTRGCAQYLTIAFDLEYLCPVNDLVLDREDIGNGEDGSVSQSRLKWQ